MTDDISLEPLHNQSSVGSGANKKLGFVPIDTVGVVSTRTPISITQTISDEVTIGTDKRTIEFQNTGSKIIYYGGDDVTSTKGIKMFPNTVKVFANVKDTFSIYFICASGESSTLRVAEYT